MLKIIGDTNFRNEFANDERAKKNISRNLFLVVNEVERKAKSKYIPVATGATKKSSRIIKINEFSFALQSLNYVNKRYYLRKPNKRYKIRNGRIIPAGKNAGKYEWYDKSYQEQRSKLIKKLENIYD